jgi:hypothetical protein
MTFLDATLNNGIDLTRITKRGLCGGTLAPVLREGDLENRISIGTAGVYLAKDFTKDSSPYTRGTIEGVLTVYPSYHFLIELRRHLSGDVLIPNFSPAEELFYSQYQGYTEGVLYIGELLVALDALDKWLTDEVSGVAHPELTRSFSTTHKWYKLETRI